MTISIEEIQTRVTKLAAIVSDKGWRDSKAELHIQSDGKFCAIIRAKHPTSYKFEDGILVCLFADTVYECLSKAASDTAKIEDVAVKEKHDFLKSLGHLIDKGRDIGVEIEFLNPLTAAMEKLSKNILTDQQRSGASELGD